MAPVKTSVSDKVAKAKKAPAANMSADKVVKRPARGYHKFRSGLLNVTPKGAEKEITKANQQSPLLRLPPEIRNAIWKLALCRKVYRPRHSTWFSSELMSPGNNSTAGIPLLRVCRQIYAEAAEMPLLHNAFSCSLWHLKKSLKVLNKHQRAQMRSLHIEINGAEYQWMLCERYVTATHKISIPKYLPGLEEVVVRMFSQFSTDEKHAQEVEDRVRKQVEDLTPGMLVNIRVDQTTLSWRAYDDSFKSFSRNDDQVGKNAERAILQHGQAG